MGMFIFQVHSARAIMPGVVCGELCVLFNKGGAAARSFRDKSWRTARMKAMTMRSQPDGRDRRVREGIERVRTSLGRSRLNWSLQRERIVQAFLQEEHITVRELYGRLNRQGLRAPLNTIYRTMRVLCEKGFAEAQRFGEETQYDNLSAKGAHDHLICTGCGHIVEFEDPAIERLRQEVATDHGFHLTACRLELYGLCGACRVKSRQVMVRHVSVAQGRILRRV